MVRPDSRARGGDMSSFFQGVVIGMLLGACLLVVIGGVLWLIAWEE